ncbi:L-fucose/L-arabinose isomerase family protein [Consotaella salsifontis]|uniref:L-arabinose isomerase n=1 Tax=Consotaella salsifontis TaxID=1365950 RepID=A0A1T4T3M4_9HYPH|nr:L-fucose/L-arabinose isomerase family protein [Consotaella salsifontis]SKA35072.1 L-arabinose isomerase [Consotaella salsifontis]
MNAATKAGRKPVIGLLGIMQELYDAMLPGITERQEGYGRQICDKLSGVAEMRFPSAARNRDDIERIVRGFQEEGVDGILIVMLTYGPGLRLVNAMRDVSLPLMLANVQPEPQVTTRWDMGDLTYNQGVHGAQDTANTLNRLGKRFSVFSGDWQGDEFVEAVKTFACAAQAKATLRKARIAVFGQMPGMGDILTDSHAFMRVLGVQVEHWGMGTIVSAMEKAPAEAVEAVIADCRKNFEIDPMITEPQFQEAAKIEVGLRTVLEEGGFDGFSVYFNQIGFDGRFNQIHMMAASNLMAEGYGYAAEGDSTCAALMVAARAIAPDPHFTEMYAMDFERDAVLQSHMGEGNWKVARKDKPVKLIDRPLGIGGLGNPPTVLFMAEPGPATLVSLVALVGEKYRLVVSQGTILDTEELPTVEMPYFFFKPDTGVTTCLDGWLKNGGTHHQVLHLGDVRARWKAFCDFTGIEYVEV